MLDLSSSMVAVRAVLGSQASAEDVVDALGQFRQMGLTGQSGSAWLRSLETMVASGPATDLVWSGPEVSGLHARDTRRVFEDLLGSAERSVWVCTFAFFDGPKAFEIIARRMDQLPLLRVVLLLNIQRRRGDQSRDDDLVQRFSQRFWSADWPGLRKPDVYYDPRSLALNGPDGVLHAKAVTVDSSKVFVTSANLTEAALDRNIELGLVVSDRALAMSVETHFRGLIDKRLLRRLPG